jgi:hypothetical protein
MKPPDMSRAQPGVPLGERPACRRDGKATLPPANETKLAWIIQDLQVICI